MHNPPTMQDIASAAGVGKATVSLALRNDPRLRPETRRRIQEVAAQLGYRANATVAHLMAQLRASRTPKYQATLAMLNAAKDPALVRQVTTFRLWLRGCQRRADQLGYGLDHFWLHEPGLGPTRLIKTLDSRNIRGVLLYAVLEDGTLPKGFEALWERVSAVGIGIHDTHPPLNCASNDQYSTAYHATLELLKRGYRKPAMVINPTVDGIVDHRFSAGYWSACQTSPLKPSVPIFDFAPERMLAFQSWFREHRPDAIVCLHPQLRDWLRGMHEGEDTVALVHLDRAEDMHDWAGMDQHSERVGAAAVDMLVGQIHRNETGIPAFARSALVQSSWVEGPLPKPKRKS